MNLETSLLTDVENGRLAENQTCTVIHGPWNDIGPKIQAEIKPSAKKVKLKVDVLPKKCDRESTLGRKSTFIQKATFCELSFGHFIWIESSKPLSFLSRFKNLEFVFRTECMIWTNKNYFSNFKFWCHLIPTYIYLEHITTIF